MGPRAYGNPCEYRFDNVSGSNDFGEPNDFVPEDILASIKRNGTCLKVLLHTSNEWIQMPGSRDGWAALNCIFMPVPRV